jgi:hypothetical protein
MTKQLLRPETFEPGFEERLASEGRLDDYKKYVELLRHSPFKFYVPTVFVEALKRFPALMSEPCEREAANKLKAEDCERLSQYEEQKRIKRRETGRNKYHIRQAKIKKAFAAAPMAVNATKRAQLDELAKRTKDDPIQVDRDLEWAYSVMGMPSIMPRQAPSVPAFHLWRMTMREPEKFLEKFTRRQENNRKASGGSDLEKAADEAEKVRAIDKLLESVAPDIEGLIMDAGKLYPAEVERVLGELGYQPVTSVAVSCAGA